MVGKPMLPFQQNHDKQVVVAEGFDMETIVKNSTAIQFTIRNKPLQEVSTGSSTVINQHDPLQRSCQWFM